MAGFSVDTHLLRELGELLVGRDSTAILELIKNAYDADATEVILHASGLGSGQAVLRVVDNGNGMTYDRFQTAFLRIAGRDKEGAIRRSPLYGRRYTGQKGIGRLAAHKLAASLKVVSAPRSMMPGSASEGVYALLDWDLIEQQDTLDELSEGLHTERLPPKTSTPMGTLIELQRLRSRWTDRQLAIFVSELKTSQPPEALADPGWVPGTIAGTNLISAPLIRDVSAADQGFQVKLSGDLDTGDDLWDKASENFEWLVEIEALGDTVRYQIAPLASYAKREPAARAYYFEKAYPGRDRPRFQARIFTNPNSSTRRGPLAGFVRSNAGVRVYLEGFRVLPYGEHGDDWLGVDRDYRSGPRFYTIDVDQNVSDELEVDRREALSATGNIGYFGAVFLTEDRTGGLMSLVNREGFIPNATFEALVELVRTGVNLSVRVRRAVANQIAERERRFAETQVAQAAQDESSSSQGSDRQAEHRIPADQPDLSRQPPPPMEAPGSGTPPSAVLVPTSSEVMAKAAISEAQRIAEGLRTSALPAADASSLEKLIAGFTVAAAELERLRSLQPDLRVLASVGLQLGAFVHDVNGMLGQASTVKQLLEPLMYDQTLNKTQSQRIRRVGRALDELTHSLARQSSYLTDVLVTDPRRRRSRLKIKDRLAVVQRLLHGQLARLDVTIEDLLDSDAATPPMFPAEAGVLLTNLLTNAVKNAGSPGRVRVEGRVLGRRGLTLLVHNTGVAVDLTEAERWFLPFESTTTEVNEVLGQGLGLGLPITRALVEDYRGTISFVEAPPGFATSVRVDLPDPQER
ncbi:ATP-binding protein [Micromonospora sp. NPDC050495]|uniref:ATP-binding protein n=1 Tax=Micromonospora sp. NPDC050495 TaxID=3154936 RepID=UPI0033CE09D3